uniref:Uncharacterized protein n=1 Tax=Anopheles darlingi TaxID=43151 RepID=A0A2M4DDX2_ANODA
MVVRSTVAMDSSCLMLTFGVTSCMSTVLLNALSFDFFDFFLLLFLSILPNILAINDRIKSDFSLESSLNGSFSSCEPFIVVGSLGCGFCFIDFFAFFGAGRSSRSSSINCGRFSTKSVVETATAREVVVVSVSTGSCLIPSVTSSPSMIGSWLFMSQD